MIHKRKGKPANKKEFIEGAKTDKPVTTDNLFDPDEPRTQKVKGRTKAFKTIGIQFNQYEWFELELAEKKSKRTKNSIIREGIENILKELNNSS